MPDVFSELGTPTTEQFMINYYKGLVSSTVASNLSMTIELESRDASSLWGLNPRSIIVPNVHTDKYNRRLQDEENPFLYLIALDAKRDAYLGSDGFVYIYNKQGQPLKVNAILILDRNVRVDTYLYSRIHDAHIRSTIFPYSCFISDIVIKYFFGVTVLPEILYSSIEGLVVETYETFKASIGKDDPSTFIEAEKICLDDAMYEASDNLYSDLQDNILTDVMNGYSRYP